MDDGYYSFGDGTTWNNGVIRVTNEIHLSFGDRLRVLFGQPIICESRTLCENEAGRVETRAHSWAVPFRWFEDRRGAEATEADMVKRQ